ncbi:hypothetical protein DPX16_3761 [Anabarilius grahami]|uniref:Uncharacterized protein n=1 Tax=Anabarilius grahami TaxID=495550 RepID=A0A3N0XUX0_ANAGA|nr:hypothetical protein DPX16_3761 [Anabarilius grahami]
MTWRVIRLKAVPCVSLMTEYLLKEKHIPCLQDIPLKLRTQEEQPPSCFVPKEGTCPYCPGPTPPALHPYEVITTQATVYGISYVRKVGTFKRPDPDTISEKDLQVDIVKSWSDLNKSQIAEGLISALDYIVTLINMIVNVENFGTTVANPFSTSVRHSTLAPWMGEHTRVGNVLPKTEAKKTMKKKKDDIKHHPQKINEDILLQLLESKKVFDFKAKQIRIYDSLMLYTTISDSDMDLLSVAEIRTGDDTESTEEKNLLIRDSRTAADWCSKRNWDGKIQFPTVLSMEKEEQIASKCKLQSWIGEYDESSPAELFTFVFEKKVDYDVFWTEMVDKMKYRIFARFEKK